MFVQGRRCEAKFPRAIAAMTDEDEQQDIFMESGKEGSYFEREAEQLAEMKAKGFEVKDGEAFTFRSGVVYKAFASL